VTSPLRDALAEAVREVVAAETAALRAEVAVQREELTRLRGELAKLARAFTEQNRILLDTLHALEEAKERRQRWFGR
jgi:phage-related tail protein